jgi:hypothetical protein
MYGFLQLISDGSPNKEKEKQGEEEKRIQANTLKKKKYVNYFWVRIVERNRFPELTSF